MGDVVSMAEVEGAPRTKRRYACGLCDEVGHSRRYCQSPRKRPADVVVVRSPKPKSVKAHPQDHLAVENIQWASKFAMKLAKKAPFLEYDDVIGEVLLRLVQAARSYEPARGYTFRAYAVSHVRGAVIDLARRLDTLSRDQRRKLKVEGAGSKVMVPWLVNGDIGDLERENEIYFAADNITDDRVELLELHEAMKRLPKRLSFIMRQSIVEEKTMKQIADELGVSECRVCQLMKVAREKLADEVWDEWRNAA